MLAEDGARCIAALRKAKAVGKLNTELAQPPQPRVARQNHDCHGRPGLLEQPRLLSPQELQCLRRVNTSAVAVALTQPVRARAGHARSRNPRAACGPVIPTSFNFSYHQPGDRLASDLRSHMRTPPNQLFTKDPLLFEGRPRMLARRSTRLAWGYTAPSMRFALGDDATRRFQGRKAARIAPLHALTGSRAIRLKVRCLGRTEPRNGKS